MVLLKRREVEMVPPPDPSEYEPGQDPDVFYMASTGEIFLDYESYAQRLSFYNQPVFQDELTGKLNLTYFQAIQSEREELFKLQQRFPEFLKAPVLSSVQFHITGRLDELIDAVFDRFKERYFTGEQVFVDLQGDKYYARVMDVFPPRSLLRYHAQQAEKSNAQNGNLPSLPPPPATIVHRIGTNFDMDTESALEIDDPNDYIYSVQLIDEAGQFTGSLMEARNKQLSRDRLTFSKTILKKYLREALIRESTVASPWIVKDALARRYHIPTAPSQARMDKNNAIKETKLSKRKKIVEIEEEDTSAPAGPKKRKTKAEKAEKAVKAIVMTKKEEKEAEDDKPKEKKKPIKFPIEDLEVDPATDRELKAKIIGEEPRRRERPAPTRDISISLTIFEPLMVTYHFLHAFGKPLMLAPFTLDDYESALQHNTPDPCPLITEIHAALLNVIVRDGTSPNTKDLSSGSVATKGAIANGRASKERSLTPEEEEEDEESGDELEDSREGSAESEEADDLEDNADELEPQEPQSEVIKTAQSSSRGWEKKILKLEDGRAGWENSLLGLIAKRGDVDLMPRMMGILSHLTGKEHPDGLIDGTFVGETYFTPKERYPVMPVSDKLAVIHFLCDIAVMTKTIKSFFDECEATLTDLRKERVELSRQRKKLLEERAAEEKKKELEANGGEGEAEEGGNSAGGGGGSKASSTSQMTPPPGEDEVGDEEEEEEEDELQSSPEPDGDSVAADSNAASDTESVEASTANFRRALPSRQQALREKTLQRKAEEAARQAERARLLEEQRARNAENRRLLAERNRWESEEERISLREEAIDLEFRRCSLAPRLRPLGKDRFHDKYWWFDGIGTQDLGSPGRVYYGTGRIFVQGCSEEDWKAMCDGRKEKNVIKRREIEHGDVVLERDQWAVYDQPEQIDQLIAWLRNKGNREYALKRQLTTFKNYLQPGIQKRLDDLEGGWKNDLGSNGGAGPGVGASLLLGGGGNHGGAGGAGGMNQYETRRSSRKNLSVGVDGSNGHGHGHGHGGSSGPIHKYLSWSNTFAIK